ncbi:MAG TPA: class I SAM-dependent methyltransferase [Pyrinomonadaceae bacterium]|nr:class I SAM-dependent methyltransferase [Pyrinomonadaceae bacterium]
MSDPVTYVGKDLEAMSFAVNYHKWILDEFRPYLGNRLVEVGAGTGNFTQLLVAEKPKMLTSVEPSEMFGYLKENVAAFSNGTKVNVHRAIFAQVREAIAETEPDSILYVNVLEHIEDDRHELEMIRETLVPGGRCFIFVPALMSLYGEFDRKIGHFRRYSKSEIEEKCRAAGFKILVSKYFDFAGIIPWWIKYKLLKSDSLERGAVDAYDKFAVPVTKALENFLPVPSGKNILLVGEK